MVGCPPSAPPRCSCISARAPCRSAIVAPWTRPFSGPVRFPAVAARRPGQCRRLRGSRKACDSRHDSSRWRAHARELCGRCHSAPENRLGLANASKVTWGLETPIGISLGGLHFLASPGGLRARVPRLARIWRSATAVFSTRARHTAPPQDWRVPASVGAEFNAGLRTRVPHNGVADGILVNSTSTDVALRINRDRQNRPSRDGGMVTRVSAKPGPRERSF